MTRPRSLSYPLVALELGIRLCTGEPCDQRDHEAGAWSWDVVHWRDRRVTKSGLYRFLRLAALALNPGLDQDPVAWRRTYLVHRVIDQYAKHLKVVIPRELTTLERRRVKGQLAVVPTNAPLRQRAMLWARR